MTRTDIVVYGCGCETGAVKSRFDAYEFCPAHKVQQRKVRYIRPTLSGQVIGEHRVPEHTPACAMQLIAREEEQRLYWVKWPNHCQHCEGWGFFEDTYDPSPAGVGLSAGSMVERDPCPNCAELFYCPRCGSSLIDDLDDPTCAGCGFDKNTPGAPPAPECVCPIDEFGDLRQEEG